jgi:[ribosomal protein S5]-alanine N-acetyltransferase
MLPILETQRLLLRPFTLEDATDFWRLNAEPGIIEHVGKPALTSLQQAIDALKTGPLHDYRFKCGPIEGLGRLACIDKASGALIGFAGLKYVKELDEVDVGYRFLPEYWGKGLASEAAARALEYGRKELALARIVGIVDPRNTGSVRVLQKLGLKFEKPVHLGFTDQDLSLYA